MPFLGSIEYSAAFGHPVPGAPDAQIYLDAANSSSYPGSGSTWFNLGNAGSTYNFSLVNSPSLSNVVYNGTTNQTLSFNGIDEYATPATSLLSLAQATNWNETREYWVYWQGSPGCLTMESGVPTPDTNWYDAQASMSNTFLAYSMWQNAAMTAYVVYSSLTSNTWNHIVWQHNKGTNTLMAYVNGVRTYSNSGVGRVTPPSGFYTVLCAGSATNFGYGSGSYLGASLGIYRWYNRILDSNQINQNFESERARFGV